jgi:hypothetical protein
MNREPPQEKEEEDQVYLGPYPRWLSLIWREWKISTHQDEEGWVYLQVHLQQGQPLPDLNEPPTHDQEDINHLLEGSPNIS